jgi:hypothetical protein
MPQVPLDELFPPEINLPPAPERTSTTIWHTYWPNLKSVFGIAGGGVVITGLCAYGLRPYCAGTPSVNDNLTQLPSVNDNLARLPGAPFQELGVIGVSDLYESCQMINNGFVQLNAAATAQHDAAKTEKWRVLDWGSYGFPTSDIQALEVSTSGQ